MQSVDVILVGHVTALGEIFVRIVGLLAMTIPWQKKIICNIFYREPPIMDPPRSGQPLQSGQTLCYGLKVL